jgi:hypothetical protein
MAGRGSRSRKPKAKPPLRHQAGVPTATALPHRRDLDGMIRRRGMAEVAVGAACLAGASVWAMLIPDTAAMSAGLFLAIHVLGLVGALAIASGGMHLDRRPDQPVREDKRRWIYGILAVVFGLIYAVCMWKVIPNRMPSAMLHLSTVPAFTLVMAIGTLVGRRFGWWLAVVGGSLVLLSTIVMIARILASAAFLAGVYGAFGKAAATFALVAVALIVELVAILPICQVKFLMSRVGQRTYGV